MKILIIGLGSIGRRHAQNFHALGCEIGGVDTNYDRIKEAVLKVPLTGWTDLHMALTKQWDGVVIATPPAWGIK
jgi:lactate dehydrogenase-like 2-hydroxyacid dehydrogenase